MKNKIKKLTALLLATLLLLLCACGAQEEPPVADNTVVKEHPLKLTVAMGGVQDSLEPTYSTADGGETILFHLYENLLRWEDDGNGYAVLAPGQAESYTVELDYAGNATYTFKLRDDIIWSDGQSVTSYQFAAAWQRLADPAYQSPHRDMVKCIAGYEEVQSTGASSLLQVSTPDSRTLVVKLNGNSPYFLEVVCAGAYTMPIRTYLPGNNTEQIVTNGPFSVAERSADFVRLVKSETYYDRANVTVDEIRFVPASGSEADYAKLCEGKVDFTVDLPSSVLQEMAGGDWVSEPVASTYVVILNTLQPPFDNADVRAAFRLSVDEQVIVDALADYTSRAATGLVPYGVTDFGSIHTEKGEEQTQEDKLPDPNAPTSEEKKQVDYFDFRAHGTEIVTLDITEGYEIDCTWARALLSGAGYVGGGTFPEVEYIYVDTPENAVVAQALCSMWQSVLGVTVTLRALSDEEYAQMLTSAGGEIEIEDESASSVFHLAALELTGDYNDAYAFLSRWHSENPQNFGRYSSAAFDILINAAAAAVTPESYDAYLHDAEAILLKDAPVIPVFYRGGSYALSESLESVRVLFVS